MGKIREFFFSLFGKHRKYRVDYNGEMKKYENAKRKYRAGEEVKLALTGLSSDAEYIICVDGAKAEKQYGKNRIDIRFIMPSNDVKITCFYAYPDY